MIIIDRSPILDTVNASLTVDTVSRSAPLHTDRLISISIANQRFFPTWASPPWIFSLVFVCLPALVCSFIIKIQHLIPSSFPLSLDLDDNNRPISAIKKQILIILKLEFKQFWLKKQTKEDKCSLYWQIDDQLVISPSELPQCHISPPGCWHHISTEAKTHYSQYSFVLFKVFL